MSDDSKIIEFETQWLINGNYFTKALCNNDLELAKKYAETLINCFGCVDCVNCKNCSHCVGCSGCKDCEHCQGCNYCDKCSYCIDCKECSGCENATQMSRLKVKSIPQQNMAIPMNLLPMYRL